MIVSGVSATSPVASSSLCLRRALNALWGHRKLFGNATLPAPTSCLTGSMRMKWPVYATSVSGSFPAEGSPSRAESGPCWPLWSEPHGAPSLTQVGLVTLLQDQRLPRLLPVLIKTRCLVVFHSDKGSGFPGNWN